jgi:dienelactone hydrolase
MVSLFVPSVRMIFGDVMRALLVAVISCLGSVAAFAQAVDSGFAFGRDYTFERMTATRRVNDADDKGNLRLVSYVYRPAKAAGTKVVLFSHGSTGGLSRSAKEPLDGPPFGLIRFFVSRGYTLVVPMRRGRAESSGKYVEECSVFSGECTTADQLRLGERGIKEALADSNAVLDQIVFGKLTAPGSKIIAAGISRGGFLSLMLAAERREIAAIVNFVGGWYGVTDNLSADDNRERMADHKSRLERAAKKVSVPSIWIYAARDAFNKEGVPQELHRYWTEAGTAPSEFVFVPEHNLANGHLIAQNPALWEKQLDLFLKEKL